VRDAKAFSQRDRLAPRPRDEYLRHAMAKFAWLFPGQGAQAVGMGKDLVEVSPAARDVFARVDSALGFSLSKLCFEGPESDLTLTENTQPAIVATSIAILAALREKVPSLPEPAFAAGHSLGEYAALVAAGAMRVEDACVVVNRRGKAMQSAVPAGQGAMSAVMAIDPSLLEEICAQAASETGEVVSPANFNAPGQIVIAGGAKGVARANAIVAEKKGKAIPLKVSAPFHCALMRPAADVVRAALDSIAIVAPKFPVVANVDAQPRTEPAAIKDALVRQVDAPVRWQASVGAMAAAGVTHAIEIGPGKVLQGLVKRIAKDIKITGVSDAASLEALPAFLATVEG
jgi:[acyl-carrier-protein] S-malonyltransferase